MSRTGLSSQMAEMRASIEKDSQLGSLMAGLRGSNMNSSDFAEDGVVMQLVAVEADEAEQLPLVYNPDAIAAFWSRRPIAVARRVVQLLHVGWPLVAGLASDVAWGKLQVMAGGCMPPTKRMCCLLGCCWCALRGSCLGSRLRQATGACRHLQWASCPEEGQPLTGRLHMAQLLLDKQWLLAVAGDLWASGAISNSAGFTGLEAPVAL